MRLEPALRGFAGVVIIGTVLLTHFHSQNWLWATGFVGLNLLQSSVTNWCPALIFLRKAGMK